MMNHYKIIGEGPVELVVELGLGACLEEWLPVADKMKQEGTILLYERAGIHLSTAPEKERTPENIARELAALLKQIEHKEQIILIAHSQGGLYAQQFVRLYPQMVKALILLDPLSANDIYFKEHLTDKEYKMSGVDKSQNFVIMEKLAKLKLGGISKILIKNAPPFYYYDGFSKEQKREILSIADSVLNSRTVLAEYRQAHMKDNVKELTQKGNFPDIPLFLITHSSKLEIEESMKFGKNTREFAAKVEEMWQDLMKEYLTFSCKSEWIQATESVHYIHLQQPQLLLDVVKRAKQ